MNRGSLALGLVALGLAAATGGGRATRADDAVAAVESTVDARFEAKVRDAAKDYESWGRVDDEARWAPYLCRQPNPSVPRLTFDHGGRKLYYVFAKDREDYVQGAVGQGQAVVKESWVPEEVVASAGSVEDSRNDNPRRTLVSEGKRWHAKERAGLFVLLKLEKDTPGTDEGWVYGTVSTKGEVTAAGNLASCRHCHELAKDERLFGLAK